MSYQILKSLGSPGTNNRNKNLSLNMSHKGESELWTCTFGLNGITGPRLTLLPLKEKKKKKPGKLDWIYEKNLFSYMRQKTMQDCDS